MSGTIMLVLAYGLVWIMVFGYLAWMSWRQERLRREVEALRATLASRGRQAGDA